MQRNKEKIKSTLLRVLNDQSAAYSLHRAEEVNEAMLRLHEGTYGVCVDCDEGIPDARLRVRPEAARCFECQSAREGTPVRA